MGIPIELCNHRVSVYHVKLLKNMKLDTIMVLPLEL